MKKGSVLLVNSCPFLDSTFQRVESTSPGVGSRKRPHKTRLLERADDTRGDGDHLPLSENEVVDLDAGAVHGVCWFL